MEKLVLLYKKNMHDHVQINAQTTNTLKNLKKTSFQGSYVQL